MSLERREWVLMLLTSIASSALAILVFAFGYGQLVHRVETLEQQRVEMRAEWQAARDRIDRAIKEVHPPPK
jgi:cell division protein FtsL